MVVSIIRKPFSIFLAGILLAFVLFGSFRSAMDYYYLHSSLDPIFKASVSVPNFKRGENMDVLYQRIIGVEFNGDFSVEVKRLSDNATVCKGSGTNITYTPGEGMSDSSFNWYVGSDCASKLQPGEYYLETNYRIRVEGKPVRFLKTISNIFSVYA